MGEVMKTLSTKKTIQIKEFTFTNCPTCKSEHLVKVDSDTVCLDCDWDSTLMDVTSGNFEKRLALTFSYLEKQAKPIRAKSKIKFIPKLNEQVDSENSELLLASNE